jgi:hypothetical protein
MARRLSNLWLAIRAATRRIGIVGPALLVMAIVALVILGFFALWKDYWH